MKTKDEVQSVRNFWSTEACGSHFVQTGRNTREFYERYRQFRYETEWHILELVPFARSTGKKILEIGCGNGADGVMFAQNGGAYTGVDLTETAVSATREHFQTLNLNGTFQVENAETLSFGDESFDVVYSHGVLHHSPDPAKAIDEGYRVLKPGGNAIVMLYHKHSFNYYVRIMLYMRLRVLLKVLSSARHWESDRREAERRTMTGVRGNTSSSVWQIHYENFLRNGWSYLKPANFVHHCTDGPECPFAHVYARSDIRRLFARFQKIQTQVAHFPLRKYRWGKWIPLPVERAIASKIGWYLFIFASK